MILGSSVNYPVGNPRPRWGSDMSLMGSNVGTCPQALEPCAASWGMMMVDFPATLPGKVLASTPPTAAHAMSKLSSGLQRHRLDSCFRSSALGHSSACCLPSSWFLPIPLLWKVWCLKFRVAFRDRTFSVEDKHSNKTQVVYFMSWFPGQLAWILLILVEAFLLGPSGLGVGGGGEGIPNWGDTCSL